jgi:chromosome segregation ATPase
MPEVVEHPENMGIKAKLALTENLSEIKKEFLVLRKELGEITYQLSTLYDRWSVEHQHVGKREAEMARTISAFAEQIAELEKMGQNLQHHLQDTMNKAAVMVADLAGKETLKKFDQGINTLEQSLSNEIYRAKEVIRSYKNIETDERLKMWGIVITVAVLVGAIVGGMVSWMYKPSYAAMSRVILHRGQ